jgi:hypothetical protein
MRNLNPARANQVATFKKKFPVVWMDTDNNRIKISGQINGFYWLFVPKLKTSFETVSSLSPSKYL